MGSLQQFMFGRREGKRGETLPFTRWDILLSVMLGVALMVAIAYSAEPHRGWTLKRGLVVGSIVMFAIYAAQNRKVALGCAFGLVAVRMGIGIMTGPYSLAFIAGTIVMVCAAWLLLHNLE